MNRIVDGGDTLIVIEHNLDVIKIADYVYVIDMSPDGGKDGGMIITKGNPEQVSGVKESATAPYLKEILNKNK